MVAPCGVMLFIFTHISKSANSAFLVAGIIKIFSKYATELVKVPSRVTSAVEIRSMF